MKDILIEIKNNFQKMNSRVKEDENKVNDLEPKKEREKDKQTIRTASRK